MLRPPERHGAAAAGFTARDTYGSSRAGANTTRIDLPKPVSDMTALERAIFDAGVELGRLAASGLLTFEQACKYVGLSAPQFRQLVRRGDIPYGAGGSSPRAWRFCRAALDAWASGGLRLDAVPPAAAS